MRTIPLLGALEITFELLGPERLQEIAGKIEALNRRMQQLNLPRQFARSVALYVRWLFYTANAVVKQSDIVGNAVRTYLDHRQRKQWESDMQAERLRNWMRARERGSSGSIWPAPALAWASSLSRYPFSRDEDESPLANYGWKLTVFLLALTAALAWLAAHFFLHLFPHLAALWKQRTEEQTKALHWYSKALYHVFVRVPMLSALYGGLLCALACAVYVVGWILQWMLAALLWLAEAMLTRIARTLAYKGLRRALLVLALIAIVVPAFLPGKLPCPAGSKYTESAMPHRQDW